MCPLHHPLHRAACRQGSPHTATELRAYKCGGTWHLTERSFESVRGSRQAIVHLYNSTGTLQRRVVFGQDKDGITATAVEGGQAR